MFGITGERPFHALSFPNIDFTVMRPATVHKGTATTPSRPAAIAGGNLQRQPGLTQSLSLPGKPDVIARCHRRRP